ncbi:MAG: hypothetical protein ACOY0T_19950 [Myxococcota bacterium]
MTSKILTPLLSCILASLLVGIGCGDDDGAQNTMTGGRSGSGGSSVATGGSPDSQGGAPGSSSGALYALTSNVWGPDGATGYLYTVPLLEEGVADLGSAIELPGGAWLTGNPGEPYVYVSSGEGGPTITRYAVGSDGSLSKGATINFAALGLTNGMRFGTAPMISETKGYLVDAERYRIATWNPQTMKVGKLIQLDIKERDGITAWIPAVAVRGERAFVSVSWEKDWTFGKASQLIVINTTTDEVIETHDEARCEQLAISSRASDGTVYFSPYAHSAVARLAFGNGYGTASCGLRIAPSSDGPDGAWEVDLSALAGGRPAGEFVLASDDVAFFRAFYDESVGITADNWQDKSGEPGYRWWRWEIGSATAEEIPGQDLTVEAAHYVVDGKTYVGNPSADWAETIITELNKAGELRPGLRVQGTPGGVVRVDAGAKSK